MSIDSEKYDLRTVPFSQETFDKFLGQRLLEAGLGKIRDELVSEASGDSFLQNPLNASQKEIINHNETLEVAKDASVFAERVKEVPISESFEKMVNLKDPKVTSNIQISFSDVPFHPACGDWAGKERLFWVRKTLSECVLEMSVTLNRIGLSLHVLDAFRPPGVQEGLFSRRYSMTKNNHPDWSHEDLLLETRSKTAFSPRIASHKGGAALDVMLMDNQTGTLLDIGHNYPEGGALVALKSPYVTQEQWIARNLLALVSGKQDVSLFPFEDWHISYGDNTAAATRADELLVASYGPVKSFSFEDGTIDQIYGIDELDVTFEVKHGDEES